MCMFCAAIPVTLALGANDMARRKRQEAQAEQDGEPLPPQKVSPKPAIVILTAGLVVASVVYHASQGV